VSTGPTFCLMRLGAPHLGHVALIRRMLSDRPGPPLVLVGSADVAGRADVPLPWLTRVRLLKELLRVGGVEPDGVRFSPLPEVRTDGWDATWCEYLLAAARAGLGAEPAAYYAGDDYPPETFAVLRRLAPGLRVVLVPRADGRSGRELRQALAGVAALAPKYAVELGVYRAYSADQ
jgi:hypothetical protein